MALERQYASGYLSDQNDRNYMLNMEDSVEFVKYVKNNDLRGMEELLQTTEDFDPLLFLTIDSEFIGFTTPLGYIIQYGSFDMLKLYLNNKMIQPGSSNAGLILKANINQLFRKKELELILYRLLRVSNNGINRLKSEKKETKTIKNKDEIKFEKKYFDYLISIGLFRDEQMIQFFMDGIIEIIGDLSSRQNLKIDNTTIDILFYIIEQIPEFHNIFNNIEISDIPFNLELFKKAIKYGLNVNSERITTIRQIPGRLDTFDYLPPSEILAFLYIMGRNPLQDMVKIGIQSNMLKDFVKNKFSDFKQIAKISASRNRIKPDEKKFNKEQIDVIKTLDEYKGVKYKLLGYPETFISVNTIIDFFRLYNALPDPSTNLSIEKMSMKYDMSGYTEREKEEVYGAFESISYYLPKDIVNMILKK